MAPHQLCALGPPHTSLRCFPGISETSDGAGEDQAGGGGVDPAAQFAVVTVVSWQPGLPQAAPD